MLIVPLRLLDDTRKLIAFLSVNPPSTFNETQKVSILLVFFIISQSKSCIAHYTARTPRKCDARVKRREKMPSLEKPGSRKFIQTFLYLYLFFPESGLSRSLNFLCLPFFSRLELAFPDGKFYFVLKGRLE